MSPTRLPGCELILAISEVNITPATNRVGETYLAIDSPRVMSVLLRCRQVRIVN